jgi:hypothetical protein
MDVEKINNNWKLKSIEIEFCKGFDFEKEPEKNLIDMKV